MEHAFGFIIPKINTLPTSPRKLFDKLVRGEVLLLSPLSVVSDMMTLSYVTRNPLLLAIVFVLIGHCSL